MACSRLLLPTTDSGPNFELCEPILSRNKLDRYIYKKLLYRTLFFFFELNEYLGLSKDKFFLTDSDDVTLFY